MKLLTIIAALLLVAATSKGPFSVKTGKVGPKNEVIEILHIGDNGLNQLEIEVLACGTRLTFTSATKDPNTQDAFIAFVEARVRLVCE